MLIESGRLNCIQAHLGLNLDNCLQIIEPINKDVLVLLKLCVSTYKEDINNVNT